MDEQRRRSFNRYRDIAYLFLNVSLFDVSRKLIPGDYLDRTVVPEMISRSYDDFLFGGTLFDCPPRTACEIITPFRIRFCALELEHSDGYAVMGPYLPEADEKNLTLEEILLQNGASLSERESLRGYLAQLPVIGRTKVIAMMDGLPLHLYGWRIENALFQIELTQQNPPPCPVFEEDAIQARAEAIEKRYDRERLLMDAVSRGDDNAVQILGRVTLNRLPNHVRNEKNLMIVLNTLLRKAVEQAKVHPLYIDAISGKWALAIENAQTVGQLDEIYYKMILDYCALVRKRSLAGYTSNVRAAINCIQFNMDEPQLSLKMIANSVGANASYLSHQFNQEVGISIPEYIARMRVEEAQNLLLSSVDFPVGQIAAAVGFQDVNYFSKIFKRIAGCTPSAYRQNGGKPPATSDDPET